MNIDTKRNYDEYLKGVREKLDGEELSNPLARMNVNWRVTTWEEFEGNFPSSNPYYSMAMLHHGFELETRYFATGKISDERMERFIFYLRAAHGHSNVSAFKVEDEEFIALGAEQIAHLRPWQQSKAYARQAVAKKAFAVLATHMQALGEGYKGFDHPGVLTSYVHNLRLVNALIAFFVPSGYPQNAFAVPYNLTNAEERHINSMKEFYARYMQLFIMSRRVLKRYTYSDDFKKGVLDGLPALQPEAVRILFALERYDMLMDAARYILPESLEHIKRLILLSTVQYENSEPACYSDFRSAHVIPHVLPQSFDDALAMGSKPAMMYKALTHVVKAHAAKAKNSSLDKTDKSSDKGRMKKAA